jgi:hypothetical protein
VYSKAVLPPWSVFPDHGLDPDHFQNKGLFWSDFPLKSPKKSVFTCSNIRCAKTKTPKIECHTSAKDGKNTVRGQKQCCFYISKKNTVFFSQLVCFWSVFSLQWSVLKCGNTGIGT